MKKYVYAMIIRPATETVYMGLRDVTTEKLLTVYDYFLNDVKCDISEFAIVICDAGHVKQESFTDWYQKATA